MAGKWDYDWERRCAPFYTSAFFATYVEGHPPFYCNDTSVVIFGEKHKASMFFEEASLRKTGESIKKLVLSDPRFTQKYSSDAEKLISAMHEVGRKAVREPSPEFFKEYWTSYKRTEFLVGLIRLFNRTGVEECRKWLEREMRGSDSKKIREAFSVLTGTAKESFLQKEQESFKKIFLKARKFKKLFLKKTLEETAFLLENDGRFAELNALVDEHLKKYCWFPCGYDNEEPWSKAYVASELKQALSNEEKTLARFKLVEEHPKKLVEEKKALLDELNPPESISRIFSVLSEFTFFKDYIRFNLNRFHYETRPFLRVVSEAIGLKKLECTELAGWDAIQLIEEKRKAIKPLLGELDHAFYFNAKTKTTKVFVGRKALEFRDKIVGVTPSASFIKGIPATFGKAVGRVKIVFKQDDYAGEKNIVLVSPMTTPELMAAMRNAVAIVTDEGGITCHAALVSRELGIPCIVGTKNATRIFKNGDLVEVDAGTGIMRKVGDKTKKTEAEGAVS